MICLIRLKLNNVLKAKKGCSITLKISMFTYLTKMYLIIKVIIVVIKADIRGANNLGCLSLLNIVNLEIIIIINYV